MNKFGWKPCGHMWLLTSADDPDVDWEYTRKWQKEQRELIERIAAEVYNRAFNSQLTKT